MPSGSVTPDDLSQVPGSAWFAARLVEAEAAAPVHSPCVGICKMDPYTGHCHGCRRTLDEIATWSGLDDAGKRAVWRELPGREPPI